MISRVCLARSYEYLAARHQATSDVVRPLRQVQLDDKTSKALKLIKRCIIARHYLPGLLVTSH